MDMNLSTISVERKTLSMTDKEIVQDLLQRLPEDVSLEDTAQELGFIAAVRQGLSELDRGESISIEDVEKELPSWSNKGSSFSQKSQIPPTAVGGLFRSFLKHTSPNQFESRQRELADHSGPNYSSTILDYDK